MHTTITTKRGGSCVHAAGGGTAQLAAGGGGVGAGTHSSDIQRRRSVSINKYRWCPADGYVHTTLARGARSRVHSHGMHQLCCAEYNSMSTCRF